MALAVAAVVAEAVTPVQVPDRAITVDPETPVAEEVSPVIRTILVGAPTAVVPTTRREAPEVVVLTIPSQVLEAAARMIRWTLVEDMGPMIQSGTFVVTTIRSGMSEETTTRQAM